MCYETYERQLLRASAMRRAAERPSPPKTEAPRPEVGAAPAEPASQEKTREKAPA